MKFSGRILILLLCSSLLAHAADARKKRVAVLHFEYGTVRTAVAGLFGTDVDVGRGISDLIVKNLVKDGTYSVIERHALDKILAEQNLSNSDRANPASAAQIGKLLGVDAIIVGSITQFGGETDNKKIGGGGGHFGGFGMGGVGLKKTKATVALDARMVNVDTGEIMGVAEGKGESQRSGTSLLGGGGGWSGFGGGAVDFSSSNFEETIIGEAVKAATLQLSAGLISDAPSIKARTISVNGLVAFADAGTVVLNVGKKAGLNVARRPSPLGSANSRART